MALLFRGPLRPESIKLADGEKAHLCFTAYGVLLILTPCVLAITMLVMVCILRTLCPGSSRRLVIYFLLYDSCC